MRCQGDVKVWIKEWVWFETLRVERVTYVMQQCPTTTKSTSAQCWKVFGLCGYHAALLHPKLYPKAKGHKTGGRHGKERYTIPLCEIR